MRSFDIALSFAGEDREIVEQYAEALLSSGIRIFYDRYEQASLWGKDLYQHLQKIYRDEAQYCVVFVSQSYLEKNWTRHEIKQAQSRSFVEKAEYILPVRLDDSDLPGLNATVGYIDVRSVGVDQLVDLTLEKLGKKQAPVIRKKLADGSEIDAVEYNGHLMAKGHPKQIEEAQYLTMSLVTAPFERVRYGGETRYADEETGDIDLPDLCHDCGVLTGQLHVPGCDMEQCPACDGQAISCGCRHQAVNAQEVEEWEEGHPLFDD